MKNVIRVAHSSLGWVINNQPLNEVVDTTVGGFKIYEGRNNILCLKYEKDGESVAARIFTNGRFTLKYKKGDEIIDSRKRFIPLPIDGNVILITKENMHESYAYYREIEEKNNEE